MAAVEEAAQLQLTQNLPADPDLAKLRGSVQFCLLRYDDALTSYDQVDTIRSEQGLIDDWETAKNRGNVYFRLERLVDALSAYDHAEELRAEQGLPPSYFLSMNRGAVYEWMMQYDKALEAFDQAEKLRKSQSLPDDPRIHMNRGVALERLGRYTEALSSHVEAIRVTQHLGLPDDPNLAMNMGLVLGELGRFEEALASYKESERIRKERGIPIDPSLYFARAITLYKSHDRKAAIDEASRGFEACGQLKVRIPAFMTEIVRDWVSGSVQPAAPPTAPASHSADGEHARLSDKEYDAFICYRRVPALAHAMLIKTHLDMAKKTVFRDQDNLSKGHFRDSLEKAVRGADHLIVLLTDGFFDKCIANPEDDVRREIRTALEGGTQIIPVMMEGYHWPKADDLPEDIRPICSINGMSFSSEFFPAFMDKLLRWMG